MKMYNLKFLFFCFLFGFSANISAQTLNATYMNYVRNHNKLAISHMNEYGIPASIKLAQALLESGAGTSALARIHNNHFGIKCNSLWNGPCATYADDTPTDRFRVYKDVSESYEDHSRFLQQTRYSRLFDIGITDYPGWAKGLQACGYATDKNYADKLIRLIETYGLDRYDVKVERKKEPTFVPLQRPVYIDHGILYVLAKEGDSYGQISADLGFKLKHIAAYNDAPEDMILRKGDIVYLEMKNKKAQKPYFEHVVRAGDSMYSISQLYGMLLKSLYKINKKSPNYVPREGDVLRLQ